MNTAGGVDEQFSVSNKVALVTGGASGIGFYCAIGLLENGAKGITIADIDEVAGNNAVRELCEIYGENQVIFIKTDVTDIKQFEEAFERTIDYFEQVDLLVNNAAILDDRMWERLIDVNIKGVIHGILLGLEKYLQLYRSTDTSVILNVSSTAGIQGFSDSPIYSSTKFAINGMTLSWGRETIYDNTKVKVVAVCPGATTTKLLDQISSSSSSSSSALSSASRLATAYANYHVIQTAEEVATGIVQVIENATSGTLWVIEGGELAHQFVLPNRFNMEKKYILNK